MELIVRTNGIERRLRVERRDAAWQVTIDDRTLSVDLAAAGEAVRSLIVDGRQVEAAVREVGEGKYLVSSGGIQQQVEVLDPLTLLARESHEAAAGSGVRRIGAYMPGRVVAVLVEPGDEVEAGQGIVVLEAMKMENEIQADGAGVVREIFVAAGEAVEGGDPLFELESLPG